MLLAATKKNMALPGPGSHEIPGLKVQSFNTVARGEIYPEWREDRITPMRDLGVPGPGTYSPDDHKPIAGFKLKLDQPMTKQYETWESMTQVLSPPGPHSYTPKAISNLKKGVIIGTELRHEEKGSFINSPAPNRYKPLGEFDYKNPTVQGTLGKKPKFAYGIKAAI